jgi:hypothetical protein
MTDKDAVSDAEDWIKSGGGQGTEATNKATIDFNVDFARQFAPEGETFYAKIDRYGSGPALLLSLVPQDGYKRSHIRNQKNKITGTTTKLPMIPMSAADVNEAGLEPNARYTLGSKEALDDNVSIFPLIKQGKTQSKTDAVRLGQPGLTVASSRDVAEDIDPWHGYTPDDKKANALAKSPKTTMQGNNTVPFDQMVKDTVKTHGLKWAFDYYVRKNGLPPRQFQIFAGLTVKPKGDKTPKASPAPVAPKPEEAKKKSMWQRFKDKLPFEE